MEKEKHRSTLWFGLFFLTSSSLNAKVIKTDILPGYKTGNSLITLYLLNNQNPGGPGKSNTSFSSEDEYINLIKKKKIKEVGNEYENNDEADAPLVRDTTKMHMLSVSLNYTRRKMRELKLEEASLERDMLLLQRKLEENNLSILTSSERCRGYNPSKRRNS